jgi:hypothetical protein
VEQSEGGQAVSILTNTINQNYIDNLQLQEEHISEIERENERLNEQNKRQNEAIDMLREMYAKEDKP